MKYKKKQALFLIKAGTNDTYPKKIRTNIEIKHKKNTVAMFAFANKKVI